MGVLGPAEVKTAPLELPADTADGAPEGAKDEVPSMPPSPAKPDEAIAKHAAEHHLDEESELIFYKPASVLLQWGQVQPPRHADAYDLFFDIIMVAAAFQMGNFLKDNLTKLVGPLGLVGIGLTLLTTWSHILQYRSRFEATSLCHRMLDSVEGVAMAGAAHNVVPDLASFKALHMYVFVTFTILGRLTQVVRRIELMATADVAEEDGLRQRKAAQTTLSRLLLEVAFLAAAYALTEVEHVMYLLIAMWVSNNLSFIVPMRLGLFNRNTMVPMHIEYTLHRMGEMVMLMIGEGMLSLVIATTTVEGGPLECSASCWDVKLKGAVSFVSGFGMLASFMFVYYRSNPHSRHHHATRRNAMRGMSWNVSHWILALGLIASGVSIKSIHPYAATYVKKRSYIRLLSIGSMFAMPTMTYQQVMHPGVAVFFWAPYYRARRLGLFGVKLLLSLAFIGMLWFPQKYTDGYVYLLYACGLAVASAGIMTLEKAKTCTKGMWAYADELERAKRIKQRHEEAAKRRAMREKLAQDRGGTGVLGDDSSMGRSGRSSESGSLSGASGLVTEEATNAALAG